MSAASPRHQDPDLVRRRFETIIGPVRAAARDLGYAIAVHGSLARDIDLVAIPWTEDAADAEALVEAVRSAAASTGDFWAGVRDNKHGPTARPHGRECWVIHLADHTYIDLSIMPRKLP